MTLFDSAAFEGHESVNAVFHAKSGLKAIIAVHSTARGPAAGGCRLWPYPSAEAALTDALRLSRAMSYKNAVADLAHGGGKAVIIADGRTDKSSALFEAFGSAVEGLGGRYWTAEDVGVSPTDLAAVARTTRYVAGLEGRPAASGDPSPVTAEGVFRGLTLAVGRALGRDLKGLRVAVQGVGHVGGFLAAKLHSAGARLIVCDVDQRALRAVVEGTGAQTVAPEAIFDVDADVFAPCALGGALSHATLDRLSARVIAGGANNQLASADVGERLHAEGRLYAPDYVINGGGIINVAAEIRALEAQETFDPTWVSAKLDRLMTTLDEIFARSAEEGRPTDRIAGEIAEARMAARAH